MQAVAGGGDVDELGFGEAGARAGERLAPAAVGEGSRACEVQGGAGAQPGPTRDLATSMTRLGSWWLRAGPGGLQGSAGWRAASAGERARGAWLEKRRSGSAGGLAMGRSGGEKGRSGVGVRGREWGTWGEGGFGSRLVAGWVGILRGERRVFSG
jgi:hypothetical protein